MKLNIIILAAGAGKRMFSDLPKVLHLLAGKTLLQHVVDSVQTLKPDNISIVIGHQKELVKNSLQEYKNVTWVVQDKQLGTGHAAQCALENVDDDSYTLILCADVPLIKPETLRNLLINYNSLNLLTAKFSTPYGLGRIIRDSNKHITGIVEEKDATDEQKKIEEIYSGIMACPTLYLKKCLNKLTPNNAQQEYYLTDIINMAYIDNQLITSCAPLNNYEIQGINSRKQLHDLERIYQTNQGQELLELGVQILDLNRFDNRGNLSCGKNVTIDINCIFNGNNVIQDNCLIGANCHLTNVSLGANTIIHPFSVLANCIIEENCEIGPFARVRPGTHLKNNCKIGNFVEIKNSKVSKATKINHLSYIGDADIGNNVNIGAGTITCNYDGVNKYRTTIKDGAFIGSGTQLVAPIMIGTNAIIGAGTTLRKDAPENALTLTKAEQKTVYGWKRKQKEQN